MQWITDTKRAKQEPKKEKNHLRRHMPSLNVCVFFFGAIAVATMLQHLWRLILSLKDECPTLPLAFAAVKSPATLFIYLWQHNAELLLLLTCTKSHGKQFAAAKQRQLPPLFLSFIFLCLLVTHIFEGLFLRNSHSLVLLLTW